MRTISEHKEEVYCMNIQSDSIRLLSFNVLFDYGIDNPHSWQSRREYVFSLLRFHAPDIFCLQEPLQIQVDDFAENFPDYNYLSVDCGDGMSEGQHMSIFYLTEKFETIDSGKFGLSEMPEKMGLVGWDAKNPRLALWVKLLQKNNKQTFYVVTTHLDHIGENARQQGALLLGKKIDEITGGLPVLLCGDFNANPDSQTYKNMIDCGFADCSNANIKYNLPYTYHRFLLGEDDNEIKKFADDSRVLKVIDHIFYKGTIQVLRHGVISDNYNGVYPSDHFPKMCDILL
jgi:endonuclease/exonuclease/phosphatase family metal-dependent hydrolase